MCEYIILTLGDRSVLDVKPGPLPDGMSKIM